MHPELKTTLNALIVAIGFALSPVVGMAQQAPAAQSQSQSSPNVQQQNSNPVQTLATQGGTVHAQLTRKNFVHGTSDRSSKPRYVPTGGGDKGGPAGARAYSQNESAKIDASDASGPAAGGGDKSIDAQGAVNLASPSFVGENTEPISDSQASIDRFFVYLTTNLEKRVEDACYSSPASNEIDSADQENCARQAHEFVHDSPLETTLLNDDSYEASLIFEACPSLVHDISKQVLCFQAAIQGSRSLALLNMTTSCQNEVTTNQCYTENVSAIANEPSTVRIDGFQFGQQK